MATILLQAAGGFVGGLVGGPFGAIAGRALGALGGYAIDQALFSQTRSVEGPRLGATRIMDADEGAGIARLYGTGRIAGQVLWTTRFEERRSTERQGGKGFGGGGAESEVSTYSYFGNVAIGLCEGPVAAVRRVWADGEEMDLAEVTFRVHRGTEEQMPDPLIEAKQGEGNAPAYRGLAYVVFERLALERWGNRIPQISCEVLRPVGEMEGSLRAVTIIPGASEHGLDPLPVRETVGAGEDRTVNRNMLFGASDWHASVDELTGLCPKLERAALVVAWFGDDLRAGHCEVRPGVEVQERDESEEWRAGGVSRDGARLISRIEGAPAYGGTPNDAGVIRAIADLKARGLKVTYYPFMLMDVPPGNGRGDPYGGAEQAAFPWRGRMTLEVATGQAGSADGTGAARAEIAAFLGSAAPGEFDVDGDEVSYEGGDGWSYRRMVLHQAQLARTAGGVDAFVIGSEMRGLTRVRDGEGRFPFVEGLMGLAADVKAVLPDATVTYAADWSEYFGYQPEDSSGDVFYNLDPLWAHPAIDVVGIDCYLPLADWRDGDWDGEGPDGARSPYDRDALRAGITGGEYHDWYYASAADRVNRVRTPISDGAAGKPWVYRTKDLKGWWSNRHFERRAGVEVGAASAWVPMSKPVWLTELGCPAIDKGANQPNVFVDPKSSESFVPHFSGGARDDLMQRRFVEAHLRHWDPAAEGFVEAGNPLSPLYGGRMVEPSAVHVWTWDARPYPAFPERFDVWSDGGNWRRGHWLNGRLGRTPLDALIAELLRDHGFGDFDVGEVDAEVGGYLVPGPGSARGELEELMRLCSIAAHASSGRLVFRSLRQASGGRVLGGLVDEDGAPYVALRRMQAGETSEEVVVGFSDPARSYQSAAAEAVLARSAFPRQDRIELPVVLEESEARRLAGEVLADGLAGRETARFSVSPAEIGLEPGDRVRLADVPGRWLVSRIESGMSRRVEARKLPGAPGGAANGGEAPPAPSGPRPVVASRPVVHFLDLPLPEGERATGGARIAVHARPWLPYWVAASATGSAYDQRVLVTQPATMGRLAEELAPGPEGLVDPVNRIKIELFRGALASVSRESLLSGANLCAIQCRNGGWEVLQFEAAEESAPMRLSLRGLLRAQGGTEDAMAAGAAAGAAFVVRDEAVPACGLGAAEVGRELAWRIVPSGRALDDPAVVNLTVNLGRRALRPLSPVHLKGGFDASGAFALSWIRRTRIGGDGWDGIDVPLGEEIERYRVILADPLGAEIAVETGTASVALSAEAQGEAFGGLPAELVARVAQVSLAVGPGTEREAVFRRAT